ncbi:MAG TPA: ribosome maturation factor RimP [Actinomycetes bacterium]|nr:ribosome maturation factor RimP [Actinomycetes bacterium]
MTAVADRVQTVVAPLIAAEGLDLEAVDVQPAGRRRLVRVVVDRDGGISLDGVAALSHALSEALDASDAMGDQPYVLEVTSPGVDRPLTLSRHWRRNVGRLVAVSRTDGSEVRGRIAAARDEDVTLDTDDGPVVLPLADVGRARIEVEFNRPDGD